MKYLFAVGFLVIGTIAAEKQYSVSHTVPEWQHQIQGLAEVQRIIHKSEIPANEAFSCDSILQVQIMDISRQVSAAINDTTKTKKP